MSEKACWNDGPKRNDNLKGYWHCSFCNDVVILPKPVYEFDRRTGAECPRCKNNSATFMVQTADPVPPPTVTCQAPPETKKVVIPAEVVSHMFDKMRKASQ